MFDYLSRSMTKPTKWPVHPAETQISLGICPVWSVFAVRMKKHWVFNNPLSASEDSWADWANARADLSLRWAHRPFSWFCHASAHLKSCLAVSKELARTATGRLNNGVAQVPPRRGESDLDSFRQTLPIYQYGDQILETIEGNQVTLVSGETGSGKTTQVSLFSLYDTYAYVSLAPGHLSRPIGQLWYFPTHSRNTTNLLWMKIIYKQNFAPFLSNSTVPP